MFSNLMYIIMYTGSEGVTRWDYLSLSLSTCNTRYHTGADSFLDKSDRFYIFVDANVAPLKGESDVVSLTRKSSRFVEKRECKKIKKVSNAWISSWISTKETYF